MSNATVKQEPWQTRALRATGALEPSPRTQLGAILLAILGMQPRKPPRFSGTATITSDGYVLCNFETRTGAVHIGALVCHVSELRDNFRRLADHLKLSDKDRDAMFSEVLKWISIDYRAIATRAKEDGGLRL